MRIDRLIILFLIASACKTAQVTTSSTYKEDLSVHRLPLKAIERSVEDTVTAQKVTEELTTFEHEITAEIDSVSKLIVLNNEKRKWDGYTIQVYRGNSRSRAYQVKEDIESFFPELTAEVLYYQPSYRVKAGKFFDRLVATRQYEKVKELYPRSLLLPEKLSIEIDEGSN